MLDHFPGKIMEVYRNYDITYVDLSNITLDIHPEQKASDRDKTQAPGTAKSNFSLTAIKLKTPPPPPPILQILCIRPFTQTSQRTLNVSATGEPRTRVMRLPPVSSRRKGDNEPEDRIRQVDPDGALHALNVAVALGVLVNVHVGKDAKQGDPQDKEDKVPAGHEDSAHADDEGDKVDEAGDGR